MPFGEERARQRDVATSAGLEQHPRETRMERQAFHAPAERRHLAVTYRAQLPEERHRGIDSLGERRVEPLEDRWITAPREDVEHRIGEIDAVDLRFTVRAETVGAIPEAEYPARTEPARPTGALIGGVGGDPFQFQRIDAAVRIVARHLLPAGINDAGDVRHCQRRLGDVGGENHPARSARGNRAILIVGRERSVQREDLHARTRGRPHVRQRAIDLGRPGEETQHTALPFAKQRRRGGGDGVRRAIVDLQRDADVPGR